MFIVADLVSLMKCFSGTSERLPLLSSNYTKNTFEPCHEISNSVAF